MNIYIYIYMYVYIYILQVAVYCLLLADYLIQNLLPFADYKKKDTIQNDEHDGALFVVRLFCNICIFSIYICTHMSKYV
jgi:hypothetical protein